MQKNVNIFKLLLVVTVALVNCNPPPSGGTNFKDITLTVTNFMSDCKAGDINNGTGTSDVNYIATIVVTYSPNNNNTYIPHTTYPVAAPSGPNKGTISRMITIPTNRPFKVEVTIDASECSICSLTGCPLSPQLIGGIFYYFVNKPYWKSTWQWATYGPNTMTLAPESMPRSIPVTCPCHVKKN